MISSQLVAQIASGKDALIGRLRDFVAIPSLSSDPAYAPQSEEAARWLVSWFESLGGAATVHPLPAAGGVQPNPIVTARFMSPDAKRTVLVYGHYDVQPAKREDGWDTDPWMLAGPDASGYLYGRGVIDDKGQVCSVIAAIEAHIRTNTPLPVNIVFLIEGMEESGSEGLDGFIEREWQALFSDVSSVLICDTEWMGETVPTVVHALRGLNYFEVTVLGASEDLHSGTLGGVAWEPANDLIHLFSRLREGPMGPIRIPGMYDNILGLPDSVRAILKTSSFDVAEFLRENGLRASAVGEDVTAIAAAKAFAPTLSIHGIGKVFPGPGAKTVIPAKATGYMSTRLVPRQDPATLAQATIDFLRAEFASFGSPNTLDVQLLSSGNWWYADPSSPHIDAALRCLTETFGVQAAPLAEGGSIPVAHVFSQKDVPVVLMSLGKAYSRAHGPNERHHVDCLVKGAEAVARYLDAVAAL